MGEGKPRGYWKDLENVLAEIERVKQEHGFTELPSSFQLEELGQCSLTQAVRKYHGGFAALRERLGARTFLAPNTWKRLDYVLGQLKDVMRAHEFVQVPSDRTLRQLKYHALANAIVAYHGGFGKIRKRLGQKPMRAPDGSLRDRAYVIKLAKKAMREYKSATLPPQHELNKRGYSSLCIAVTKYHGGMAAFRRLLGQEPLHTEDGAWKDQAYMLAETRKVIDKHGFEALPGSWTLNKLGYSGLAAAISQYHGGFTEFRKLLGHQAPQREPGVWKDQSYGIAQAREVMRKHGLAQLPSQKQLIDLGYSSLNTAIHNYYGGFHAFRDALGEQQTRVKKGSWESLEFAILQAKNALQEMGVARLPCWSTLNTRGYSALANAIQKQHGGFPAFRAKLEAALGVNPEKEQLESLLKKYAGGR